MNEKEFQEKLQGILVRRYGVHNVHVTAGAAEYGVDIVFIFENSGPFGESLAIGLQLKVEGNMSTTVAQKSVGQVVIALGHEFIINDQHRKRLDLVYILNYGRFNPQATEYLADAKTKISSLMYLDITRLEPFLSAYSEDVTDVFTEDGANV